MQPVARFQAAPSYPFELRKARVSGEALVEFIVTANGTVRDPRVVKATHAEFGDAAVAAVHKWQFHPGMLNGKPVDTKMIVPLVFDLDPQPLPVPVNHVVVSGPIYDLRDLQVQPRARHQTKPQFPTALRRAGISGEAVLEFVVTAEGFVGNIRVLKASHEEFATAAVAAVSQWIFAPGMKEDKPVNARMVVPMGFTLNNR